MQRTWAIVVLLAANISDGCATAQSPSQDVDQTQGISEEAADLILATANDHEALGWIQQVINNNIAEIQQCYENELYKHEGLSGRVDAKWTIQLNGKVHGATVEHNDTGNTALGKCIQTAISAWRFPRPTSGEPTEVNYPFIFRSIGF